MLADFFCTSRIFFLGLALLAAQSQPSRRFEPDPPQNCAPCAGWNAERAPFKIHGNTYFVGTAGLGSVLITSNTGHILLDGGLPESAPVIDANIRTLGFRTEDIKLIVTSHTHYDHVGGVAALQRYTGAIVAASPKASEALRRGKPTEDDPQFLSPDNTFPAVANIRTIKDGEVLRVGGLSVTAHFTPGHTPGGTTWTWQSCEATRCLAMVYADSLTSVSADGFRYTGDAKTPSRVDSFMQSIATIEALECDALIPVHPSSNPFMAPDACRKYAAGARKALNERVARERQ